ncbi:unnamed protein product [Albugo candida]|nr:unnamed protein product [Albugo candida]|eukprot:CCI45285.1 unnamed protein product [Albugo candida]
MTESDAADSDTISQDEFYFASDLVKGDIATCIEKRSIYELFRAAKDTIQQPNENNFHVEQHTERLHDNFEATNRLEMLAQPRTKFFAENQKQRLVREAEILGECTFHPNLEIIETKNCTKSTGKQPNPRYQWLSEPKTTQNGFSQRQSSGQHVSERLHLDSSLRYELRDQAKQQMDDFLLHQECTFRPCINPISKTIAQPPLYERIPTMRRQKDAKMEQLRRECNQENRECTFHPVISVMSRKLARIPNEFHITRDSRQKCLKKLKEIETFHPTINNASKKLIRHRPEFQLDFVSRQTYFQHSERQKHTFDTNGKAESIPIDSKCTFTPDIGNADAILRKLRPERVHEPVDVQVYRMTYKEPKERQARTRKLRQESTQCTFKPRLNTVSKALGKPTPLEDLSRPNRQSSTLLRLNGYELISKATKASKKERGLGHCNETESLWQSEKLLQVIDAERIRREKDLEARRREKAVNEMKECTFRPKLKTSKLLNAKASSERPIIIRGLERFMESREMARQKEKQQQAREHRVFFTNYKPRKYTIPKPFQLSQPIRKKV